ncbi:PqqD family protein [Thermodesulfobacteriota bacterium]
MDMPEKYISKGKDIKYKELESKSVLLNLETGRYYTLNKVGTFIWELIDGKINTHDIIDRVIERFSVDRDVASNDVKALLESLREEGLIELHNGLQ